MSLKASALTCILLATAVASKELTGYFTPRVTELGETVDGDRVYDANGDLTKLPLDPNAKSGEFACSSGANCISIAGKAVD